MVSFYLKYLRFLVVTILFFWFSQVSQAQVTLVNYDFNSGTSYATLSPTYTTTGITSVANSNQPWQVYTGTASRDAAFTSNPTGQALAMEHSDGGNTKYFQFQLGGDSLVKYSAFKVYVQAQRSLKGAQKVTLSYSTDGTTYINFPTILSLPVEDSFYETVFDLSSIPSINTPPGNLYFRLIASEASETGTLRIDNFQVQGTSPSNSTDIVKYFRSKASGDWSSVSTWEMSADYSTWVNATITPNYLSNTIEINHVVTLNNTQTIDQTIINSSGELQRKGGLLTITDNTSGVDLIIYGKFNHNGASTLPTINLNATCLVKTNGVMQADITISGLSDLLAGIGSTGKVIYENQSTFYWNSGSFFGSDNQIFFPSVSPTTIPIFKVGKNVSIGANSPTTFNGVFEANGNVSFQNTGTKTFRNGIRGTGNVTQFDATAGQFLITGGKAELGGTGTITLNQEGMEISAGSVTRLSSNKLVNATSFFGTFTLAGTLDAGIYSLSGTTSFTMKDNASLITAHNLGVGSGSDGSLAISGSKLFYPYINFIFNGSTGQQQTGTQMPTTVNNMTINNSSGVNLVNNTTLMNSLTLTQGHLFLGASTFYDLFVNGNIVGADATKFVVTNSSKTATTGFLIQNASAADKWFPIGSTANASDYTPAFVTASASNPIYKARVFDGVFENGTGNVFTQQEEVVKKTWQILPESPTGTADIKIQWNTANEGSIFKTTRETDNVNLHITGTLSTSTWASLEPSVFAGTGPFTLSNTGVSSDTYTFFTAYDNPNSPLPISLLSFAGYRVGNGIKLAWTTTAEINSAGFEVQRSADLKDFVSIGFVQAAKPGQAKNNYTFMDENFSQASYYRLKQIDLDGHYEYIKPIFIEGNSSLVVDGLLLYPNPTEGIVHLTLPDNVAEAHLKLVSANGIILADFTALPEMADTKLSEHLSQVPAGLYFLQTIQGNQTYGNKLVKR